MSDIAYNGSSLIFKDGDLQLVNHKDEIIQHILTGLKILKGDWYLDYRKGIDYINGMKAFSKLMKSEIKKAILEVDGVDAVKDYKFKFINQRYIVSATVTIENSEFYFNEEYSL